MSDTDVKQKTVARFHPADFEKKWREKWQEEGIYTFQLDPAKKKYYPLVELPYPSGDLHIGHWFSFATADVHARVHRMKGENVFFTNGFDAFGLPAENAAIKRGLHPQDWTMSNIASMEKQFQTMGTMIDWSHETITCLPEYYKWNQWIFTRMYEKGLAYRGKMLGNWCPVDQTVLANEHVENGRCWRCGAEVVQKEIEQWFIKLTAFADELIWPSFAEAAEGKPEKITSATVDWPESVKVAQNQWIGKSEGAKVQFAIKGQKNNVTVFTTRIDTIAGATFLVLAPEHELVDCITTAEQKEAVVVYKATANKKTELERKENKEKTGVFTGVYALNPVSGEEMPVWIADYVLSGYGTGAIMAVPAHDERDFEFAKKFDLPIKQVVQGEGDLPIVAYGSVINSGSYTGLTSEEARKKILADLVVKEIAEKEIIYHIHDWSISRQRYWGTPVPMIHCEKDGIVPVPDDQLPVTLPYDVDFAPKGEPPLATAKEWMKTTCPKCGGEATRDPETLDTFFDSSWYFWRYLDPHFDKAPFDTDLAKKMMPVDIYFGGAEHTLGHTLYARFFTKFFKMLGLTGLDEFAQKRVQHGVILGPDGNRMSKSKGNVINPDDIVREYGADAARMYLCFMMPYDATAPWDPKGIWGVYRFLKRVWDLSEKVGDGKPSTQDKVVMNKTIKKVGEDAGSTKFNTAVAELMKWLNHLESKKEVTTEEYKNLLLTLAPFAPYMTEELWQRSLASDKAYTSIHQQSWPEVDKEFLVEETAIVVVQVDGKMRGVISIATSDIEDREKVIAAAQSEKKIIAHLQGGSAKKIVYVPGKILNFVLS